VSFHAASVASALNMPFLNMANVIHLKIFVVFFRVEIIGMETVGVGSRTTGSGPTKDCHVERRGPKEERPTGFTERGDEYEEVITPRGGCDDEIKGIRTEEPSGSEDRAQGD